MIQNKIESDESLNETRSNKKNQANIKSNIKNSTTKDNSLVKNELYYAS
jgi:hypothetical protein